MESQENEQELEAVWDTFEKGQKNPKKGVCQKKNKDERLFDVGGIR